MAKSGASSSAGNPARWLLLIHQLPAKPAYMRVKLWRRLQGLGAVAVKNAVYALPASEQGQEDFEWLVKEIVEAGGEALICEARLIDGLSDGDVRELFRGARDSDYAEIAAEARALGKKARTPSDDARADLKAQFARLKARHQQTVAIDFFDANGRQAAEGLVAGLEKIFAESPMDAADPAPAPKSGIESLQNRVWVTRTGVHVDRIACAWMIKRFIDADAGFKFVPPKGYVPEKNELRFDMFEAEFTHEGDRCSFEVLLERARIEEPALVPIAEIVHDIDLKDGKFAREEAAGVKTLINGICAATHDDEERIARGSALFDDLFTVFKRKRVVNADRKAEA
jgi:hypothetical protein